MDTYKKVRKGLDNEEENPDKNQPNEFEQFGDHKRGKIARSDYQKREPVLIPKKPKYERQLSGATLDDDSCSSCSDESSKDKKFGKHGNDLQSNMSKSLNIEWIADELQPDYLDQTMKKRYRWVMLILCCLFVVPNYFCYDNPAAL